MIEHAHHSVQLRRGPLPMIKPDIGQAPNIWHYCQAEVDHKAPDRARDHFTLKIGEGGDYISDGSIFLGGRRPNNTSGGHLCESYTHGMNMVVENVRQLRGEVDDYCANWQNGEHSHDYSEGKCRALKNPVHTLNMGWAQPATASALLLTNDV